MADCKTQDNKKTERSAILTRTVTTRSTTPLMLFSNFLSVRVPFKPWTGSHVASCNGHTQKHTKQSDLHRGCCEGFTDKKTANAHQECLFNICMLALKSQNRKEMLKHTQVSNLITENFICQCLLSIMSHFCTFCRCMSIYFTNTQMNCTCENDGDFL